MTPPATTPPARTPSGGPAARAELTVPARPPERGRRKFGATWWGRAWLEALEQQAGLDPKRLSRGRGYARSGAVGDAVVRPGSVAAPVSGSRPQPYRVRLTVPTFTAAEWGRALAVIGGRLGHTAALLSGELPAEIVDDVRAAGLSLLPGPRDLSVSCSCPDWAVPCKHAAALCMVMADVLDEDPFAALLLRGRPRDAVLTELRRRRSAAGTRAKLGAGAGAGRTGDGVDGGGKGSGASRPPPLGVPAVEAYQRDRPSLPRPLPPPEHPGAAPDLPPSRLVDVAAVARLAAGAAERAHRLLTGETTDTAEVGGTDAGGTNVGGTGQNPP